VAPDPEKRRDMEPLTLSAGGGESRSGEYRRGGPTLRRRERSITRRKRNYERERKTLNLTKDGMQLGVLPLRDGSSPKEKGKEISLEEL